MELQGKVVVVTGAGSGIGRALVEKFIAEGAARVVGADIDAAAAARTARDTGCIDMAADVSREEDIRRVIDESEARCGPIDLFCSNAGVFMGASEQAPDSEWQLSWGVNLMAHVYAARHLVPRMLARGSGYLLNTASAAGLLNQIGGAAYGTTKHAAVGFAEWLAMTYGHQGLRVSVLCPQAVRTAMTEGDNEGTAAASVDGMLEPAAVAEIVVEHLRREAFLILPHGEVQGYLERKASDYDRWIGGMNRLFQRLTGA